MLFTLRLREGLKGVVTGLIDAADLKEAERVGRTYCAKARGRSYINVESAILANASLLSDQTTPSVTSEEAARVSQPERAKA